MDIHGTDFEKRCSSAIERMDSRDKELVVRFANQKKAEDVSGNRLVKIVYTMKGWRRFLPDKRYEDMNKEDIVNSVAKLNQSEYSENTKKDFKKVMKGFFRFIKGKDGKENPHETAWLKCEKKRNKERPNVEIITPEEAEMLADATDKVMEKAFILALYETGARIGEILPIHLSQLVDEPKGIRFHISGKTGARSILLSKYVPDIRRWLQTHPQRNNPDAYVWLKKDGKKYISYAMVNEVLARAFEKAQIKKKRNPHFFRHSRISFCAKNGWTMTELCDYFGWVQASKEASTYIHTNGNDCDNAVMKLNGDVKKLVCKSCGTENDLDVRFTEMEKKIEQMEKEAELVKKTLKVFERIFEKNMDAEAV